MHEDETPVEAPTIEPPTWDPRVEVYIVGPQGVHRMHLLRLIFLLLVVATIAYFLGLVVAPTGKEAASRG